MEEKIKYLELVEGSFTQEHLDKQRNQNPYVAYSIQDDQVIYNIIPEPVVGGSWVTFTAEEANSSIGLSRLSSYQTLEYSTDTITWNNFDKTTTVTLPNAGDKVYVRGILSGNNSTSGYTQFTMSGKIAASGNCNALWNYENLGAPLKAYCGYLMFGYCSSLTTAPELPSIELVDGCYYNMFMRCTQLEESPILPATSLPYMCYTQMFMSCANLKQITCLATDRSGENCTAYWVHDITGVGTFIKHPDATWPTGRDGILEDWTVENAVL